MTEKVHWQLPRRRCGCCQKITTAAAPHAQAGSVVYGPGINAAVVLLSSEGNVPVERTAALMEALLGTPVSSGFVARALARLAQRLQAAGFDAAVKEALQAEDVLCGDETPANVIRKDADEHGETVPGAPHAVTIRTPGARLIWYAAMGSRSGPAIAGLGVLEGWHDHQPSSVAADRPMTLTGRSPAGPALSAKKGKGSTGHGNPYLARILGNAAAAAGKTDTFLGERYRRIARRRGSKRAIVAVGRSILVIIWHLLSDPDAQFYDLGPGFYAARIDPERRKRTHVRQLEELGYTVTLQPAARTCFTTGPGSAELRRVLPRAQ